MASLDWHLTRTADVTLVELLVTSERDERVRIESRLDPVWPPRRQGVPAAGWQDTGFEGVLSADEPLVLGYASPAAPVDPPAEITDEQPVSTPSEHRQNSVGPPERSSRREEALSRGTTESFEQLDDEASARAIVRALGGVAPPRDAVPLPTPNQHDLQSSNRDSSHSSTNQSTKTNAVDESWQEKTRPEQNEGVVVPQARPRNGQSSAGGTNSGRAESATDSTGSEQPVTDSTGSGPSQPPVDSGRPGQPQPPVDSPHPIESWFMAIESRIEDAEQFSGVNSVSEAREVVETFGGIEAVRKLDAQLAADRRQLETVRERYGELESRLLTTDVPLSTLERLV